MPTGLQTVLRGAGRGAFDPALLPGAALFIDTSRSVITKANVVSGTGVSLTKSGSTMTFTGASGFVASHSGGTITLAGYAAGNNGKFSLLTGSTGSGTFTNAAGANESGTAGKTWAVEGQCVGITDLVSGATLTQAGAITSQLAICTSDNAAGHPVIGQTHSGARFLTIDSSARAGLLDGSGPSTWFTYFTPRSYTGSPWVVINYRDQIVGTANSSYASLTTATVEANGRSYARTALGGATTAWTIPNGLTTFTTMLWYSLLAYYDGAGNTDWYINGAYVTTTTGTVRTLTALRAIVIGLFTGSGANPGAIGGGKIAGLGVWTSNLGAANIAALDAYFRVWQP